MVNKKKIDLNLSEDEETPSEIKINKNYAERYDKWRNKEELQKLKDKYGDVGLNDGESGEDASEDESEDDDAKELNKDVEREFFKALSLVKSRDSLIYDKEKCRFFNQSAVKTNDDQATKKSKKAYFLKDLERDMILKKLKNGTEEDTGDGNIFEEDQDDGQKKTQVGYYEEQDELKKSFKEATKSVEENDEDDDGFLKVKSKTKEEKEKEEADYIEWLKGKKKKLKDQETEQSMKFLHDYWNDPNLNESEKYLRDYILNKRYLFKEDEEEEESDEGETACTSKKIKNEFKVDKKEERKEEEKKEKPAALDYVDFSEEESIIENQEEFERKYNFRFEEPDPDFIKSYPRTFADSMRRKETKRKEKREEYKKRKEMEKQRKKEEIKRLKSLKRKEIEEKLEKIKKITGNEDLKLSVDDLEKDFDPDEYERKMQTVFNDEYYQQKDPLATGNDEDDDKPIFTDDSDEDLKYKSWDDWPVEAVGNEDEDEGEQKKSKKKKKKKKNDQEEDNEPDFDMDCETQETTKALKKTKLAQVLLKEKPKFDPNDKSFEEYFEEYYKLDCEDVIGGDLPCRFKYREVVPNDFGLDVGEILTCKDTELNKWASLKKVIQYRPIQDEIQDQKVYKHRKNQLELKQKVLTSMFQNEEDEESEENEATEEKEEVNSQEVKKLKPESEIPEKDQTETNEIKPGSSKKPPKKQVESGSKANGSKPKKKKFKKAPNMMESITDERLASFGLNPKKFKKKLKYSSNPS